MAVHITNYLAKAAFYSLSKLDRIIESHSDHDKIVIQQGTPIQIGDEYFVVDTDTNVSTSTDLDTGSISNGKDYYVYACNNGGNLVFKITLNSTYPSGYNATNSRKIGGFHTLCVSVGTISGHTLSGYVANDILPASIWDLKHRPRSNPEGMVYVSGIGKWVDIYLASGTGSSTLSAYGGTISDTRDWMDFVDDFAAVGKHLPTDPEFQAFAAGSNEETNITGSADPVTTGGHSNTASRRMISNYGVEDCCGAMWQWLSTQSYGFDGAANHTHQVTVSGDPETVTSGVPSGDVAPSWGWYDLPGSKGSLYRQGSNGDVKLIAGGRWDNGSGCGSRCRYAVNSRWYTAADFGARGISEPL